MNYSSQAELDRAVEAIAYDVAAGKLHPDQVDEALVAGYLYTADLPSSTC